MAAKLRRVIVIPDGDVSFTDGTSVTMDAKAAKAVIGVFKKNGLDLPFDYEHATTVKGDEAERAPAAGWIKELTYEQGKGLIAHCEFLPEAEEDIVEKRYRYVSPVFWPDGEGRPKRLHSCALTNTPKTQGIPEILAAKAGEPGAVACSFPYVDATSDTVEAMHEAATALSAMSRLLKMMGVETAEWTPDQVIEGGAQALDQLVSALEKQDMADDKSTAAKDTTAVPTPVKETGKQEGGALVVQLREVLNLGPTATPQEIVDAVEGMRLSRLNTVPAAEHAKLVAKVDEMEADRRKERIEPQIAAWIRQNKLNAADTENIDYIRAAMYRDEEKTKAFVASLAPVVQPGAYMAAIASGGTRDRVIAKAARDWDSDHKTQVLVPKKASWVNQELRDHNYATLTTDEASKL